MKKLELDCSLVLMSESELKQTEGGCWLDSIYAAYESAQKALIEAKENWVSGLEAGYDAFYTK